ncbi:MAG: SDR family NAD(P)-dependent oxidoreductase [Candidatus Neomarinimicrobiota bacterium]
MAKYQFKGKRAIITGASSGIGAGIAREFGRLEVSIVLTARREDRLEQVAGEVRGGGGTVIIVPGDVSRKEDVERVVDSTLKELGGVDIMVNCAGVGGPAYFEDMSEDRIRQHMEVHYFAATRYCRLVVPVMKEQGEGYIVNMASVSALLGFPRWVSYGASKAALLRFSDSLRHELKPFGIKISVLCPSLVDTPLVRDHWDDYGAWAGKFKILEVVDAVRSLIKGMKKGRFVILDAWDVKLMYALYRYFPETFVSLFTWLYKIR